MSTQTVLGILLGYLLGSIPFTQIVARWRSGIDLRRVGSKNVGGMNTMRNVGIGWGLFAGALDVAKGAGSILLAKAIGAPEPAYLWVGLAAVAGHNWPVWLNFQGGKGIAVAIGLGAVVAFPEMLLAFIVGVALFFLIRKNIILASLSMFFLTIGLMIWRGHPSVEVWLLVGAIGIMVLATLPAAITVFRTPGGVRRYFENPTEAYEKPADDMQSE